MRKIHGLLILFLFITFFCDAQEMEVKNTKVFLLTGQSNMDGRADANGLSEVDKARLKKAQRNVTLYYNFEEGKPLDITKAPRHTAKKFSTDYIFGPELFFGIEMSEKYPDYDIILIKRSRGGMSLYGAWNPDWSLEKATLINEQNQPKLYSEFVSYSKSVLSKLKKDSYELCGMLWVQGESDSGKKGGLKPREAYEDNLKNLVSAVRRDFKHPKLPYIMFQVGHGKVVEGMKNIANADDNVVLIPQEKNKDSKFYFERNPPPIGHYVTEAMKKIGVYFFKYYENLIRFRKKNLIPWSIVGFDVKERSPKERLEMLERLGYSQYAYGYRPKHIPTMKLEWELAKEKDIEIKAVWLYINLDKDKDKVGALKPEKEVVFKNLKDVGLKTQIWVGFQPTYFDKLTDEESLKQAVAMIEYLSQRAEKIGCKIALYNHGGWFGKPENQLRIIKALPKQNLGVVFNFHHAHDTLENYSQNIVNLLPYLWCVNLNGMKAEGPKILTIGDGDKEKEMINQLINLGYDGPFGILGHVKGGDPEPILNKNFTGLQHLMHK
ncbi:sialate O-acetylesterase [Winogradskyella litorisediminis]|uniref:Sialate O-acetylesterase n=1 Tax=Winogradskyella litorisediminis TaxID=1156618 RepID=A0ABW3N6R5_9FLAO